MSMDLFLQGPSVYGPYILITVIVTILIYGAFPVIYARLRKKPITNSKYRWMCYGINLLLKLLLFLLPGNTSVWPYILWTSVFATCGIKTLRSRGLLIDSDSKKSVDQPKVILDSLPETTNSTVAPEIDGKSKPIGKAHIEKNTEKIAAQRYCKLCGGRIDRSTKKCEKCGKQYFRFHITVSGIFAFVFFISTIVIAGMSIYQNNLYRMKISQLEAEISDLQTTINSREATIEDFKETVSDKNLQIGKLHTEKTELQRQVDFFDKNVVFVTKDDTSTYHKYDCLIFKINTSGFWAYNIDAAKSKGIKPCWYCD